MAPLDTALEDAPAEIELHAQLNAALRRVAELEAELRRLRAELGTAPLPTGPMNLFEVEAALVKQAMERAEGNISRAARALGLSRSALYRRLERHKIQQ